MDDKNFGPLLEEKEDTFVFSEPKIGENTVENKPPRPRISPETRVNNTNMEKEIETPKILQVEEVSENNVNLELTNKPEDSKISNEMEAAIIPQVAASVNSEEKTDANIVSGTSEPVIEKITEEKIVEPNETLDKGDKKKNFDWIKYINVIVFIIVTILFVRTAYAFFIGFKYYDTHFKTATNNEKTATTEGNNVVLSNTDLESIYSKINIDNNDDMFNTIYSGNIVTADALNNTQKIEILLSGLTDCNNLEANVSLDLLRSLAISLFNDESLVNNISEGNYGNYTISYDSNGNLNIAVNACPESDDFIFKSMSNSITDGDLLYIYENFGFFKNVTGNTYEIYSSANASTGAMYTDIEGDKSGINIYNLTTYKWTYKKGSDNNYYFISISQS